MERKSEAKPAAIEPENAITNRVYGRRQILQGIGLGLSSMVLPVRLSSAAAAPAKVSGPYLKSPVKLSFAHAGSGLSFGPVFVAIDRGFFKRENLDLDVTNLNSGGVFMAALAGRSIGAGAGLAPSIPPVVAAGQAVRAFATVTDKAQNKLVVTAKAAERAGIKANQPIDQRVKALKGMTISITGTGSASDRLARYILKTYGLDPDRDVNLTPVGDFANQVAAFSRGTTDAAMTSIPAVQQMEVLYGGVSIVDTGGNELTGPIKDQLQLVLMARKDWLDANQDTATALTIALWKTLDFIHAEPAQAGRIVKAAAYANLDDKVWKLAWDAGYASTPRTPEVTLKGAVALLELMKADGSLKQSVAPEEIIDTRFFNAAKAARG